VDLAVLVLVVLGAGTTIHLWREDSLRRAMARAVAADGPNCAAAAPTETAEPEILHPLPLPQVERLPEGAPAAPEKPLPVLDQSDNAIRASLAEIADQPSFDAIPLSKDLIRHLVVTIDNLPRRQLAARLLPLKPPTVPIRTTGEGDVVSLSPANYARYGRYVRLAQAIDSKRVAGIYVHYYPLFQQAYAELAIRSDTSTIVWSK
jgi:hypothetical protein